MRSRDRLIIQTSQRIQMAKTRKLTATFADGTLISKNSARTYTHAVRAYTIGYYPDEPNKEHCWFEVWCGRPDLMEKQVQIAKNWIKEPNINVRVEVATVTDPWAE